MATIQDFEALGLKTTKVMEAVRVEESDKLFKLQVDIEEKEVAPGTIIK